MVHAEDPSCILSNDRGSQHYTDYLASRPVSAEHRAIELMIRLMEEVPAKVHIVHLSSATSLEIVRRAKQKGLPLTAETCPHYLTFAAEEIADGATEFKCAPPIRSRAERDGLWKGLIDGDIDLIASDHSPCPPSMKESDGDFFGCWGGIASLQVELPAVWTGARARGVKPERVTEWMCEATAKLAGLDNRKGRIAEGFDADIAIWNPDASFVVDSRLLMHRHPVTPYAGRELFGVVEATFVAGEKIALVH